ncbi:MAG: hypothetical protein CYG60_14105 [Actinobacteria bacterium]|nr:MAG: hypothetical protein CYG60_14105 [Actinomycetota bacterium]
MDLRAYEGDVHTVDWTSVDVSTSCRFVYGRDLPIDRTLTSVRDARRSDVPIRNETALRYAVRPDLWQSGQGLERWVHTAFAR